MRSQSAPLSVERRMEAVARHGVVTNAALRRAGLSQAAIGRRVRSGRLRVLHRGVYALGPVLRSEGLRLAAVLACGPGTVISHLTAAAHWGLLGWTGRIHVSVSGRTGRTRRDGIVIHRPARLAPADVTVHDGVPVTTVARTLLDLAASSPAGVLDRALNEAEVLRLFDLRAIEAASRGHRGARRVGAAIERYDPRMGLTRSELERRFLELCSEAGLPRPKVNETVLGHEVDFLFPAVRRIVETDGFATHGTRRGLERDHARDLKLESNGYRVTRLSWRQVTFERVATARALRKLLTPPPAPRSPA